jgi:hypothetical protein
MSEGLQNKPIVNQMPGEADSLPAALAALLGHHGLKTDKLIPAKIVNFDRNKNIATVQPQIMLVDTSDNSRMRNQIAQVPVMSLGGGGFHISFPLKKDDLGWILAADRDLSLFLQTLKAAIPNTGRKHSFSDSWFIPDVFRNYTINDADSAAMVIQSTDGTTRIAISEGQINITAPTGVLVTTPLATFSQDIRVKRNLQVDGTATITGATTVNGGFNASGSGASSVTLPSNTTIGGVVVVGHGHISSGAGSRTSGGMIS